MKEDVKKINLAFSKICKQANKMVEKELLKFHDYDVDFISIETRHDYNDEGYEGYNLTIDEISVNYDYEEAEFHKLGSNEKISIYYLCQAIIDAVNALGLHSDIPINMSVSREELTKARILAQNKKINDSLDLNNTTVKITRKI